MTMRIITTWMMIAIDQNNLHMTTSRPIMIQTKQLLVARMKGKRALPSHKKHLNKMLKKLTMVAIYSSRLRK